MSAHPLDVHITYSPERIGQVTVHGQDVSNLITSIQVNLTSGDLPEVTLELIPRDVTLALAAADVRLSAVVHTLLEALGWTPPRGEQ